MRIALIHNPVAGSGDHSGEALIQRLRAAGHDAIYASTVAESLTSALNDAPDAVVVAGGDGTVAAVARLLAASGRAVPLAMLPMGTANNIARSFGIVDDPEALAAGLSTAERRRFDVGLVRAPWGNSRFVESAGVGLFAAMLRDALNDENAGVTHEPNERNRGLRMARVMSKSTARYCEVVADGEDLSGSYLIAMALNVAWIGPALALAPGAHVGDGQLDLLLVRDDDRDALGAYLDSISKGEEQTLAIATRRVTHVRLGWNASDGHIDDRLWPHADSAADAEASVEICLAPAPIEVLVPRQRL